MRLRLFTAVMGLLVMGSQLGIASVTTSSTKPPENFKLEAINAKKTFELKEQKGKYVALHFLLKTECPICAVYTRTYFEHKDENPNVVHVFIKPDSVEDSKTWAKRFADMEKQPAIYRDPNAKLAKAFKIKDGYKFHGETVHYPAFILLDKEGKELFRYVGEKTQDRFDYKKFKEKFKDLK